MNVLIVSEPGECGVFTYVEALCHYLIEQGVLVHMAYSDTRGSDRLIELVAHVEASGGRTVNLEVGSGVGVSDLRALWRLRRLAAGVRPDVVHCHSSKAGVLGRTLALLGVRSTYLYQPQGYYGMRPVRRRSDVSYELIEAFFGRIGTTIVVSEGERLYARDRLRLPESRLEYIANGVETGRFVPASAEERRAFREAFGIPQEAIVLGAISRMSAQKDPQTLYRAFARSAAENADLHLFHVGSGELEAEVEVLIQEFGIGPRVTRLKYLSDPRGFYKSVDGFILTSTYEGLSIASLEAMASNLPLLLSRAPGNIDLLGLPLSHVWGAPPGDVAEFARIMGLWRSAHLDRTPPNHRAMALERFDARLVQAKVLAVYRGVARGGGSLAAWSARLPVLLCAGLIAFESTARFSRASTQIHLYPAFHTMTGVSAGDFFEWNFYIRKTGHVLLYGVLSVLIYRLARFDVGRSRGKPWSFACAALALAGTALVASLDEWHQTQVPGRTGSVADVFLDSTGALVAQALLFLISVMLVAREAPRGGRPDRRRSKPRQPTQSGQPGRGGEAKGSGVKS
ncbi:MAG TPA: VanZ family protein [Opitutaceae bacterium]